MLATFKETFASLQDLSYGNKITTRTVGEALWYWSRYFLLLIVIIFVGGCASLVYYTPQLAKLAQEKLPDVDLTIKNGQASSSVSQPYVMGDKNFVFILDTQGKQEDLESYTGGLLILANKLVVKSERETRIFSFKDWGDFSVDKTMVVKWIGQNQPKLLGIGLTIVTIVTLFVAALAWVWKVSGMLLWSIVVYLAGLFTKRQVNYTDSLKLTLYASVLPLIVSALATLAPNKFADWLGFGLLAFYSLAWLWHLPKKS